MTGKVEHHVDLLELESVSQLFPPFEVQCFVYLILNSFPFLSS